MESFYKKWLEKNEKENIEVQHLIHSNLRTPTRSTTTTDVPSTSVGVIQKTDNLHPINFDTLPNIIFEDNNLQLIIEKGNHIKQRKFRLEDHLFYLKLKLKNPTLDAPYLRDILNFLEVGFDYIITQIRQFYQSDDHNIAFLTLYQQPMINGLNTGGFDIQESGSEIVDRVLKMLEQFLISNQTLKLDNTFKVYLKVLSVAHMKYKKMTRKEHIAKEPKNFINEEKSMAPHRNPPKSLIPSGL